MNACSKSRLFGLANVGTHIRCGSMQKWCETSMPYQWQKIDTQRKTHSTKTYTHTHAPTLTRTHCELIVFLAHLNYFSHSNYHSYMQFLDSFLHCTHSTWEQSQRLKLALGGNVQKCAQMNWVCEKFQWLSPCHSTIKTRHEWLRNK